MSGIKMPEALSPVRTLLLACGWPPSACVTSHSNGREGELWSLFRFL